VTSEEEDRQLAETGRAEKSAGIEEIIGKPQ